MAPIEPVGGCEELLGPRLQRDLAVAAPPSLVELTRFAGLQSLSALVNFGAYAAVLLWRPGTEPLVALVAASCVAMVVAYVGMRFAVFRGRR